MTAHKKHKILFVCLGNICRSPAAEGIMRAVVEQHGEQDDYLIDSAGIGAWHVGQLPDSRMRSCGKRHGYEFSSRARQLTSDDLRRFSLIVTMDEENRRDALRLASNEEERSKVVSMADYLTGHAGQTTIPDPYYGGEKDFELVIELLEDACAQLHKTLSNR